MRARRRSSRERPSRKAVDDARKIRRLTELAQQRPHFGRRRLYVYYERLAGEGDEYLNPKAFARLYRLGNLQVKRRRRRHRARFVRGLLPRRATKPNECWALDFVSDRLLHGRRFRGLTLMDEFSKGGLALDIAFSLPAPAVIRILDEVAAIFGYPQFLRVDNGPELASIAMLDWALEHGVQLLFIEPGKPTQNAFIESFNSRVREEFFNANVFRSLAEAQLGARQWLQRYNEEHPHSTLGMLTPKEFLALYEISQPPQLPVAS